MSLNYRLFTKLKQNCNLKGVRSFFWIGLYRTMASPDFDTRSSILPATEKDTGVERDSALDIQDLVLKV